FGAFAIGVALFRQAVGDSGNVVRRHDEFEHAAHAFEVGLAKNPTYRDALFNLANCYLGASDTAKFMQATQRLFGVDSLHRQVLTLLARAHQMSGHRNEVVAALARRDSMAIEVSMQGFQVRDSTAALRGSVQNLRGAEHAGFQVTIEFLNAQGAAVT